MTFTPKGRYMKGYIGFFVLAVLLLLSGVKEAKAEPVEYMSYAEMRDFVNQNKGKVVALNFFASWCPPCREEIPGLIAIRKHFDEKSFVILGLSVDTDSKALDTFLAEAGFNYPVKRSGGDLAQAVGVRSIPHMVVFDASGSLLLNQPGFIPEDALLEFLQKHMGSK